MRLMDHACSIRKYSDFTPANNLPNDRIREERSLNVMMPYLSSYLGHGEPSDTFYYYRHLEENFGEIHKKDQISAQLILEVKL